MTDLEIQSNQSELTPPVRGYRWRNIVFFAVTHLIGLIGGPLYIINVGITPGLILLTLFYFTATGIAVTFGYHRLFAHHTFETNKFIEFLVLFFGAASFEESALTWSSQHRTHHQYVDTDLDPYSIKKGFFYAHMGWMMFWVHSKVLPNVKDLRKSRLLMHQYRYYVGWALFAGVLVPMLIGAAMGQALGAFIIAVCARITAVYQGTFCINSVCHTFGKATYDHKASAVDNWFTALYTWGEGYHSFHHRFPNDYRNGVRWYHWDPTKWAIALLNMVGLTSNLHRACPFLILKAKIYAENEHAENRLASLVKRHELASVLLQKIQNQYDHVSKLLLDWERWLSDCKLLMAEQPENYRRLLEHASQKMQLAREQFQTAHKEWRELLRHAFDLPQAIPLTA